MLKSNHKMPENEALLLVCVFDGFESIVKKTKGEEILLYRLQVSSWARHRIYSKRNGFFFMKVLFSFRTELSYLLHVCR